MTFTVGIPEDGQTLGQSKPLVRGNLDSLYDTFLVNHQDINLSNPGTHTFVELLNQATPTNPLPGIMAHYSKTTAGVTEWYLQREETAGPTPGAIIQMSTINGTPVASSNGQTFLPGGLVMKFGSQTFPGPGGVTVVYTNPFTTLFSLQVTVSQNSIPTLYDVPTGFVTINGFQVVIGSAGAGTVYFTAIGN
jgi:hypothetical protein